MTEPGRPDLLVAGDGVDADTLRLAAALCRRAAVPLRGLLERERADERRALVLWNAEAQPLHETLALLDELARQNVGFGLVPCVDGARARAFIERTLASPLVPDRGRTAVVSSARGRPGRPPCIAASDGEVAELVRSDLDVLFIHGHGNALDLDLGGEAILCARAAAGHVPTTAPGLFRCFQPGGECFRRAGARAGAELVDPRALDASIVVTLSCHVVQLGGGTFSPRFDLLSALLESRLVAALLTTGATALDDRVLTLAMSLVHAGCELSEVARQLNGYHAARGWVAGPAAPHAPFVVVGNPCARLATDARRPVTVSARKDGMVVVDSAAAPPDPRGSLFAVPLSPADLDGVPVARMRGPGPDTWRRTVIAGEGGRREAHVWLGPTAVRRFALEPPAESERFEGRTLEAAAARLSFWEPLLDWCLEEFCPEPLPAHRVERLLLDLVRLRRTLFDAAVRLAEGRAAAGGFEGAIELLRAAGGELLGVLLALAVGGISDLGSGTGMRLTGAVGEGGPCPCGESTLRHQIYAPAEGSGAELSRSFCACGDAGQETVGTPVEMCPSQRRARRGERAGIDIACRAPSDRKLFTQAVAAVETWEAGRRVHGPVTEILLEPSRASTVTCGLPIPRELAPGLYAVSLLAIVNGGVWHRKTMFRIDD